MSGRIDHVAEAVDLLKNTPIPERAQVHATLALVEQQRIANLLALGQFSHQAGDDVLCTTLDAAAKLRAEAGKGLGL